jgi:alkylated DNA repair dioxygenase AlkB
MRQENGMQRWLLGQEAPGCDGDFSRLEHLDLGDGAWIDVQRGWVRGHARLLDELAASVAWKSEERRMYDRMVEVPRLFAGLPEPPPPVEEMRRVLSAHYRVHFARVTAAYYRDGRDSVAWHGDYVARELDRDTLVATVSLGGPRTFRIRPAGGGRSLAWSIGCGDLFVMGGSIQRTHQHSVPKTAHAEPRIAIMFRPIWP